MTNVHFLPQFIQDLVETNDRRFLQRTMRSVFDRNANFRVGENDHRYHGIEDAWIRYISRGSSAFRLIYLRKGSNVYLYRAGQHSIEDRLSAPQRFDNSITTTSIELIEQNRHPSRASASDLGELLVTQRRFTEPDLIPDYFHKMFHLGHDEIVLVSPFIDTVLLQANGVFGNFLNRQVEEGALVSLITRPPRNEDEFRLFERLATSDYQVMFIRNLHSKLFLFEIREDSLGRYHEDQVCRVAILGSSNLTERGLGFEKNNKCNEELCYRAEDYRYDEFRQYAHNLTIKSEDFTQYKNSRRRF